MTAIAYLQPSSRTFGRVLGRAWSQEEIATLRALYLTKGIHACKRALPSRSERSIFQAARRLGLKSHKRWTEEEDRIIRSEWGYVSLEGIARRIGRTAKAVYQHARVDLQVGMGAPEGSEYLTAAARRTGFDIPTLRRVLAFSGVKPRKVPTRPAGRVRFRMHYVDPIEVDDAVAKWMASEDIEPAALARGFCGGETLKQWLLDAGVKDTRSAPKQRWRVPTAVIDRVVADRRAMLARTESISSAARRHDVPAGTLRYWLVAAGIRLHGKPWHLEPVEVDRVVAARGMSQATTKRGGP